MRFFNFYSIYFQKNYPYFMEVKVKYELEFPINSSPQLLYQYISTPSGLSEWFADNVNSRGEYFTFIWNDSEEKARVASKKTGEKIKFRWIDINNEDTDYFFELRILEDEITKDVSLMIIDYAPESELDEAALLWENQISDLKHVIGSV
jgi:START domain-containing protein